MKFVPFFGVSLKGLDKHQNPSTRFQIANFRTHFEKESYFL
jgi:hypothetical protein